MEDDRNYFAENETILGLKIDVDTWRGTVMGLPALANMLQEEGIMATFFLTIGPDNMGRHIWRLVKPKFFLKMLRGNAAKLYGFDILFKGFLWPGPDIGKNLKDILKMPLLYNHEVALHAYDHYKWQTKISKMCAEEVKLENLKAFERWKNIFGGALPGAAGAPGWQISKEWLDFADSKYSSSILYRSDSRGSVFGYPEFDRKIYGKLQIPTTLPTYDEVIGRNGVTNENYNEYILSLIEPGQLNVLTIHAEAEGIACFEMFKGFVKECKNRNVKIVPLGDIYNRIKNTKRVVRLHIEQIPGRDGKVAIVSKKN